MAYGTSFDKALADLEIIQKGQAVNGIAKARCLAQLAKTQGTKIQLTHLDKAKPITNIILSNRRV